MHVVFRDEIQRKRYAILSERPMLPTRYPGLDFMETLCIEASVRYLCNQLQWEEYYGAMHVTYRNLTPEFLSSLIYEPYIGISFQRGYINFRLFGIECTFNHKEFAELLGFQYGPDVMPEIRLGYFMQDEIDKLWSDITEGGSFDPSTQLSNKIHNPAFRYFQMILAHTFLGNSDIDTHVSAEEILFLFYITQSRPVASRNFLIGNLNLIASSSEWLIHVGGTVSHIAYAQSLHRKLVHLTPLCGYTLMDATFYLDCGLMRRDFLNPNQYKLMINHETIHYFTLSDPAKTNIHDKANWTYALEDQDETPNVPRSPPVP